MAPSKVRTSLVVNCGCGFRAKKLKEGKAHVEKTRHFVDVKGTILWVPPKEEASAEGEDRSDPGS